MQKYDIDKLNMNFHPVMNDLAQKNKEYNSLKTTIKTYLAEQKLDFSLIKIEILLSLFKNQTNQLTQRGLVEIFNRRNGTLIKSDAFKRYIAEWRDMSAIEQNKLSLTKTGENLCRLILEQLSNIKSAKEI